MLKNKKMLVPIAFFAFVFAVGGVLLISSQSLEARDDDCEEFIKYCYNAPGIEGFSCTLDRACCPNNNYCVYGTTCYSGQMDRGTSGNDRYITCGFEGAGLYAWEDCDGNGDCPVCQGSGIYSGESKVGEYPSAGSWGCCGDDVNEFIKQGRDGTKACCNSRSDIVVNGKCYAKNKVPAVR